MGSCETHFSPKLKALPLLITGAGGFLGRNLAATLRAEGFSCLLCHDLDSEPGALEDYAARAAFVFHLAGVNRPANNADFYAGNSCFTRHLLSLMREAGSGAPVLLSSSAQAGNGSDYARSKEEAENAVFAHAADNGSAAAVYRLPGVFGKWSRPDYNSVVATFCHNTARGLPIEIHDAGAGLRLCYVDDVVRAFLRRMAALLDPAAPQGEPEPVAAQRGEREKLLGIEPTYEVTLGWLAGTIRSFPAMRQKLSLPDMDDAMTAKLWATYLSFLPPNACSYPLSPHADERGSFTEFLRTRERGQVSVNIIKPGVVKGNHWHNTKNEKFFVVTGGALVRLRAIGGTEVYEYRVGGAAPQVVEIPPGYTHSIQNTGGEDAVALMWASEPYDPENPDTYYETV